MNSAVNLNFPAIEVEDSKIRKILGGLKECAELSEVETLLKPYHVQIKTFIVNARFFITRNQLFHVTENEKQKLVEKNIESIETLATDGFLVKLSSNQMSFFKSLSVLFTGKEDDSVKLLIGVAFYLSLNRDAFFRMKRFQNYINQTQSKFCQGLVTQHVACAAANMLNINIYLIGISKNTLHIYDNCDAMDSVCIMGNGVSNEFWPFVPLKDKNVHIKKKTTYRYETKKDFDDQISPNFTASVMLNELIKNQKDFERMINDKLVQDTVNSNIHRVKQFFTQQYFRSAVHVIHSRSFENFQNHLKMMVPVEIKSLLPQSIYSTCEYSLALAASISISGTEEYSNSIFIGTHIELKNVLGIEDSITNQSIPFLYYLRFICCAAKICGRSIIVYYSSENNQKVYKSMFYMNPKRPCICVIYYLGEFFAILPFALKSETESLIGIMSIGDKSQCWMLEQVYDAGMQENFKVVSADLSFYDVHFKLGLLPTYPIKRVYRDNNQNEDDLALHTLQRLIGSKTKAENLLTKLFQICHDTLVEFDNKREEIDYDNLMDALQDAFRQNDNIENFEAARVVLNFKSVHENWSDGFIPSLNRNHIFSEAPFDLVGKFFTVAQCKPDGMCLFRSISLALFLNEEHYWIIKIMTAYVFIFYNEPYVGYGAIKLNGYHSDHKYDMVCELKLVVITDEILKSLPADGKGFPDVFAVQMIAHLLRRNIKQLVVRTQTQTFATFKRGLFDEGSDRVPITIVFMYNHVELLICIDKAKNWPSEDTFLIYNDQIYTQERRYITEQEDTNASDLKTKDNFKQLSFLTWKNMETWLCRQRNPPYKISAWRKKDHIEDMGTIYEKFTKKCQVNIMYKRCGSLFYGTNVINENDKIEITGSNMLQEIENQMVKSKYLSIIYELSWQKIKGLDVVGDTTLQIYYPDSYGAFDKLQLVPNSSLLGGFYGKYFCNTEITNIGDGFLDVLIVPPVEVSKLIGVIQNSMRDNVDWKKDYMMSKKVLFFTRASLTEMKISYKTDTLAPNMMLTTKAFTYVQGVARGRVLLMIRSLSLKDYPNDLMVSKVLKLLPEINETVHSIVEKVKKDGGIVESDE